MKNIDNKILVEFWHDESKTIRDIARYFDVSTTTIYKRAKKLNLSKKNRPKINYLDISNKKYNKITAIKFVKLDKFGKAIWLFKCDCGRTAELNSASAIKGLTKSCGCLKIKTLRNRGYELLSYSFYKKLQRSALSRDYDMTISIKDMWDCYIKQNKKCAISGVPIVLYPDSNKERLQTASPDRIDSNKGYIKDNFQWVHKRINRMKNILSSDEFLFWVNLIHIKNIDTKTQEYDTSLLTWD